jgi:hypothetical protein
MILFKEDLASISLIQILSQYYGILKCNKYGADYLCFTQLLRVDNILQIRSLFLTDTHKEFTQLVLHRNN